MIKWDSEKIISFTEVVTGGTPSTTIREYWENGEIPWLNSGELNKGIIKESENFITELGLKNSSARLMPINTVLVALTGSTTGVTALLKMQACANQSVTGILPSNKHIPEFLYYFLKSQRKQILGKAWGGAQPHINQKFIKDYIIPLPSISDQIKIAQILTKAETLIQQRKQSIALLDKFLKSTFLEMFGDSVKNEKQWEVQKLKKIVNFENSKRVPIKQRDRDLRDGIYPYYGATGIIDMFDEYRFDGEFLLIAEDGKNLLFRRKNNAFIANGKFWVNNHAHVLSFNGICNLRYLEFHLNNIDFGPFITGADQIKLNKENLEKIPIPIPSITLQSQFAQIVEEAESLKRQYEQSLQELENLFGSLSQKAFKRELDLDKIGLTEEEEYSATDNDRTEPSHFDKPKTIDVVSVKALSAIAQTKSAKSVWAKPNSLGKIRNIEFNKIEGDAVFKKVFSKKRKGFQFSDFERFLKDEDFNADYKSVKDFIFEKLENKELIQYYSSKEWMDKGNNPRTNPLQDDFAGDGSIWLVPNPEKK